MTTIFIKPAELSALLPLSVGFLAPLPLLLPELPPAPSLDMWIG